MGRIGVSKSTGCRTCRRRKIKCDETRPSCQRCDKKKVNCEGYEQEHRFVSENAKLRHLVKRRAETSTVLDFTSTKSIIKNNNLSNLDCPKLKELDPFLLNASEASEPKALISAFTSNILRFMEPNLKGFQDTICISFLLANLLPKLPRADRSTWLCDQIHSPAGQLSLRALGAIYFGRMHHQQSITSQASVLYGQALVNLNRDLQNQEKASSLSVLRSVVRLELYEFIAFETYSGWLKHAGGIRTLIEMRGPWRHQEPELREILEGNRFTIALECLVQRKRCFLEQEVWKTVPWLLDPNLKTMSQKLHDILCDIPGLMEDSDLLRTLQIGSDEWIMAKELLRRNIISHLRDLHYWRAQWEVHNQGTYWNTLSQDNTSFFEMALHFQDLQTANDFTTYNSILLLLMKLGDEILGNDLSKLFPSSLSFVKSDSRDVAVEICRSVEYHLKGDVRSTGAFFLLFPLRLAYQAFADDCREKAWLEKTMQDISDQSGWGISRGLSRNGLLKFYC